MCVGGGGGGGVHSGNSVKEICFLQKIQKKNLLLFPVRFIASTVVIVVYIHYTHSHIHSWDL